MLPPHAADISPVNEDLCSAGRQAATESYCFAFTLPVWALKCAQTTSCFSYFVSWERAASCIALSHMRSPDTSLEKLVGNRNIGNQWLVKEESKS